MKINIKATGIELTPAITTYTEEKLSSLERFLDQNDESQLARVEIGKTTAHHKHGEVFRAEIKLHTAGQDYYAEAHESDLYAAVDKLKDEITAEVKSRRDRQSTLLRRGGRRIKNMLRSINPWKK